MDVVLKSHEEADCTKHGTLGSNSCHAPTLLLNSQDRLRFEVLVLLNLTVDEVSGEALDGIVELVFPEVSACVSHEVGGPASILLSMEILIHLNISETILQNSSVEKGVQGVARCGKGVDTSGHNARILLISQIL